MIKTCEVCKSNFKTKPSHFDKRKTCSRKCCGILKTKIEDRSCLICKIIFKYLPKNDNHRGYYCSKKCYTESRKKDPITYKCLECEKEFKSKYKNRECCSIKCKSRYTQSFWDRATYDQKIERITISFNKKVIKKSVEECWEWEGYKKDGYGTMPFGPYPKVLKSHRASWMIHKGIIPEGLNICHKCDNPTCTNPYHLFIGTQKDNMQDMVKKNRQRKKIKTEVVQLLKDDLQTRQKV